MIRQKILTANDKIFTIMQNHNLPTRELKNFGIINDDLTFSKKLSPDNIEKFLQGYTIVADNDRRRATFQLTEQNTKLKVIYLERDKSLNEMIEKSKNKVQYAGIKKLFGDYPFVERKALIFDSETAKAVEFDLIKNARELTAIIADKNDPEELRSYKAELLKLRSFLQDKADKFPERAKDIFNDINIVSREIDSVNTISADQKQTSQKVSSSVNLDLNNQDILDDADRNTSDTETEDEERERETRFRR